MRKNRRDALCRKGDKYEQEVQEKLEAMGLHVHRNGRTQEGADLEIEDRLPPLKIEVKDHSQVMGGSRHMNLQTGRRIPYRRGHADFYAVRFELLDGEVIEAVVPEKAICRGRMVQRTIHLGTLRYYRDRWDLIEQALAGAEADLGFERQLFMF